MKLAWEIVSSFYSDEDADEAQKSFIELFQKKNIPDDMPEYQLKPGETLLDILNNSGLIKSNSEGRRLISQNGVRLDGEALSDPKIEVSSEGVLQVGKRHFLRLVK